MNEVCTHIGFADESYWKEGRFRSLGLISLPAHKLEEFESQIKNILDASDTHEFKWNDVDDSKMLAVAKQVCDFVVSEAALGNLRVDVIVWDIEDTRHKVAGRDDAANLGRMYYHLLNNVMRKRWSGDSNWILYPDEHTQLDWDKTKQCLDYKSYIREEQTMIAEDDPLMGWRRQFGVVKIEQVKSEKYPLVQLADLFAGLTAYSCNKFKDYSEWCSEQTTQLVLLEPMECNSQPVKLSRRDKARFPLLKYFYKQCKNRKMGVSLDNSGGLRTYDPENPINFWPYIPQHQEDQAPTKQK